MADSGPSSSMWSILIPILASAASGAISSAMQPRPNTFNWAGGGGGPLQAERSLANVLLGTNNQMGLADQMQANLNKGVNLRSSYAQDAPSFSGGGLPMPIGLTGHDAALNDPSLLQLGWAGAGTPQGGYPGANPPPGSTTGDNGNPAQPNPSGNERPAPGGGGFHKAATQARAAFQMMGFNV